MHCVYCGERTALGHVCAQRICRASEARGDEWRRCPLCGAALHYTSRTANTVGQHVTFGIAVEAVRCPSCGAEEQF